MEEVSSRMHEHGLLLSRDHTYLTLAAWSGMGTWPACLSSLLVPGEGLFMQSLVLGVWLTLSFLAVLVL